MGRISHNLVSLNLIRDGSNLDIYSVFATCDHDNLFGDFDAESPILFGHGQGCPESRRVYCKFHKHLYTFRRKAGFLAAIELSNCISRLNFDF